MATYFVSPSGNDANPGSLAQPFLTIAHGLGVLVAGDTLNIRAGTYDETIWESMLVTGTLANPIVIQSHVGEAVILQPTSECHVARFQTSARSFITLRGLVLDQAMATCTTEPTVLIDANQSNLTLEDCEIKNGAGNGVEIAGSNHLLTDLLIHDCAGDGLQSSGLASSVLRRIESHTNGADGLFVDGSSNLVDRCSAHGNTGDGISIEDDVKVINSLAYLNGGQGVRVANGSGAQLLNITSAKNTGDGVLIAATAIGAVVKNAILWANTASPLNDGGSGTVTSNNLTASDPLFEDQTNNDFHLQSTSPAINQGADLSSDGVIEDYDGAPRPIDDLYDIGAYEFFTDSQDPPNEGVGSASGQATVQGIGAFVSTEGIGSASGQATVQGIGEFVSSEGVGSASGQATVEGFGQFVFEQTTVNPKSFVLRIREARYGANGIIEMDLAREDISIYPNALNPLLGSDVLSGAPAPPEDEEDDDSDNSIPGSTRLELLDIPVLQSQDAQSPGFYVAASGINTGWAGAVLFEKIGSEYLEISQIGSRAVIGRTTTLLPPGSTTLFDGTGRTFVFDDVNTIDVVLIDDVSELTSVSDSELLAGVNAIALGVHGRWEVLSFGTATELGPKTYRLSHLLRGLKGTEWATGLHQIGDTMVLLDESLRRVTDEISDIGVARIFRPVSIGNTFEEASDRVFTNTGVSLKPLSPVFLRAEEDAEENRILKWWRRSRLDGLAGRDGTADPPLGEASELYEIDILNAAGTVVLRTLTATIQEALYTAAQQNADFGSIPSSIRFCVYQISDVMGRGYSGCAVIDTFPAGTPTQSTNIYRVAVTASGSPIASERLLVHPPADLISFPANLVGSRGKVIVAPTAETVFSIQKNGVQVGTMTFAAAATVATFSMASNLVIDASADVLTIVAPATPDATLADLGVTLKGSRL